MKRFALFGATIAAGCSPSIQTGLLCDEGQCPPGQQCDTANPAGPICVLELGGTQPDARDEPCDGCSDVDANPGESLSFGPFVDYPIGTRPRHVVAFDVDQSGVVDLLVAGGLSGVKLFVADGAGGFLPPQNFAEGAYAYDVKVDDIDGDGLADDIAYIAEAEGVQHVGIAMRLANGDFAAAETFAVPGGNTWETIHITDVTGDDRPDLVLHSFMSESHGLLVHDTDTHSFAAGASMALVEQATQLLFADVNEDGCDDALAASMLGGFMWLCDPAGGGGDHFLPANRVATEMCNGVFVDDLNLDERADVVFNCDPEILTFLQDADIAGSFQATLPSSSYGSRPVAIDFNGDLRVDLVTANGNAALYAPTGTSTFEFVATSFVLDEALNPRSVAAGDMSGDGKADVAFLHGGDDFADGFVRVFLQE